MAIADELVGEIFSWIEQSERCAEKLKELAQKLELFRVKLNPGAAPSSFSVIDAAFSLYRSVLYDPRKAAVVVGPTIGCEMFPEDFASSDALKDAEKVAETEGKIKQLFLQLKEEGAVTGAESDEPEEPHIGQVLGAVARRSGMPRPMKIATVSDDLSRQRAYLNMLTHNPEEICEPVHRFTLLMEKTFCQTRSAEDTVGGTSAASKDPGRAAGPAFALLEEIDNWKDLVKHNHEAEASQSLRSKADEMLEASQAMKKLLGDIKEPAVDITGLLMVLQTLSGRPQDQSSCSEETEEERWAKMALLNVRSLNNKEDRVRELVTQNGLDVFLSTETWLDPRMADAVLSRASPEDFHFCHWSRAGRGGGVAIQYSAEFQGKQMNFESMETFEYVALDLQHGEWDAPMLLVNVYRPPRTEREAFDKFLKEFQKLLDVILTKYNSVLLTGDFNVRVDEVAKNVPWDLLCSLIYERRSPEKDFYLRLLINGLVQHVNEPTHQDGHTLDLVITRNVQVSSLSVQDDEISDHYTVYFRAKPEGRKKRCKNEEEEPNEL